MTDTFRLVDEARQGTLDDSGLRRLEMVCRSQPEIALELSLMGLFDDVRVHDEGDADVDVACALAAHEAELYEEEAATTRYDAMTDTIVERVLADHRGALAVDDFTSTASSEITAPSLAHPPLDATPPRKRRREQTGITAVTEIWSAQPPRRRLAILRGFAVAAGLLLSLGAGWVARGVFHGGAANHSAPTSVAAPSSAFLLEQAVRAEAVGDLPTAERLYREVADAGDQAEAEEARRALARLGR
ncbi:MAG: hypothetical protein KF901_34205 [Myxococcales bacterium]|nr:hypothetical protein [Myxococcales bacterium]